MQTVDQDADTAVVCTDGVCRLVPVASLKRGSTPTVQARSRSMPNGRPSGSQSGSSARQRTQSARRFDIESADSDDDGEAMFIMLLCFAAFLGMYSGILGSSLMKLLSGVACSSIACMSTSELMYEHS